MCSRKNATDIALAIDAVDLLHKNSYDSFVIVSSDSDFTPLSIYLKESGVYVIGLEKAMLLKLLETAVMNLKI